MDLRQGERAGSVDACGQLSGEASEAHAPADHEAVLAALEGLERCPFSLCPRCRSTALQRWGKGRAKVQRWRCRACGRSFSATTDTLLARLHAPGKLRLVLLDMLTGEPSSCRRLAATLAVSRMTIWAWRMRVNQAFELLGEGSDATIAPDGTAAETVVLRESRKASREWVDHQRDPESHPAPDRLRWVDYRERHLPLPQPMTPHLLHVQLMPAGNGGCGAVLLPHDTIRRSTSFDTAATQRASPPPTGAPSASAAPAGHQRGPSAIAAMHGVFAAFLRPFCGPARQHLGGYVAWFVAWSVSATEKCSSTVAARAWRVLTAQRPTRFRTWAPAPP